MDVTQIEQSVAGFLGSLPSNVTLVAAAKTRTPEEVMAAVRAGVKIIGYNYIQEAEQMRQVVGDRVQWHMIGHLQRNKVKKAVSFFDMIETVDSISLAEVLDKRCEQEDRIMPVLIEINSGEEENKTGLLPEKVDDFVARLERFSHIRAMGLMTMGPFTAEPEKLRPYFHTTRAAFERLSRSGMTYIEMKYLSMGMSESYQVAIDEGANMIRIGTRLFGPRS